MKKFSFNLESVLILRTSEQEKAREAYAQSAQIQARAGAAVDEAQTELDGYHAALGERREGRSNRHDQVLFLHALQHQQTVCQRLKDTLAKAQRDAEIRRLALLETRRKKEALERLKTKQSLTHARLAQREEEAMINDLVNARYVSRILEAAR